MCGKNEAYQAIAEWLSEDFDVFGYTHGGSVSWDGKEDIIFSKIR